MKKILILSSLVLTLVACKTAQNTSASSALSAIGASSALSENSTFLMGNTWQLESYKGKAPQDVGFTLKTPQITLDSTKHTISGNDGCNSFGGAFKLAGDTLKMASVMSTKMYCNGVPDTDFISILSNNPTLSIDDNKLMLSQNNTVILIFSLKDK